jgi:hypothetical protein
MGFGRFKSEPIATQLVLTKIERRDFSDFSKNFRGCGGYPSGELGVRSGEFANEHTLLPHHEIEMRIHAPRRARSSRRTEKSAFLRGLRALRGESCQDFGATSPRSITVATVNRTNSRQFKPIQGNSRQKK